VPEDVSAHPDPEEPFGGPSAALKYNTMSLVNATSIAPPASGSAIVDTWGD